MFKNYANEIFSDAIKIINNVIKHYETGTMGEMQRIAALKALNAARSQLSNAQKEELSRLEEEHRLAGRDNFFSQNEKDFPIF